MRILGIETSCDETAAAVIHAGSTASPVKLLSNIVTSSLTLHAQTGGIIPEIAAREQLKYCLPVIDKALKDANTKPEELDAIAVTYGPGLIGSLLVGVEIAKTLSYLWQKPLIPVNHLYGHIYANWLMANSESQLVEPLTISHLPFAAIAFPAIALVVSGGHTDLVLIKNHRNFRAIGGTRDDAAGEAFDKIGRLLGLQYPAGQAIAKYAEKGDPKAFILPRPMVGSDDFDFSFSGLKTAVLNLVKKNGWDFTSESFKENNQALIADLCASIQEAIIDVLIKKTLRAAKQYEMRSILLGGGVAANQKLREKLTLEIRNLKLEIGLFVPPAQLCTDNAAMIAAAGFYQQRRTAWQNLTADPELYY